VKPEKRKKIMKAAEALFSRRRFHEITMDEVAVKAGVGKGTIYRYFKDKNDLFFEIALSGYDELCERIAAEGQGTKDFHARLVRACRTITEFYAKRRQLVHMMVAEERRAMWRRGKTREWWIERRRKLIAALAAILAEGRGAGELREDVALEAMAVLLLGMIRTRPRSGLMGPAPALEHEAIVDLFLNGAGASAGSH